MAKYTLSHHPTRYAVRFALAAPDIHFTKLIYVLFIHFIQFLRRRPVAPEGLLQWALSTFASFHFVFMAADEFISKDDIVSPILILPPNFKTLVFQVDPRP